VVGVLNMKKSYIKVDEQIRQDLNYLSSSKSNYWEFRHNKVKTQLHACAQYPAMMVPEMQNQLLHILINKIPDIRTVYDPFVGSGTILLETMKLGLDFTGHDINPLAILFCKAKKGPFQDDVLEDKIERLVANIYADRKSSIETNLPNIDKWFNSDVAKALSKIRRAIRRERALWARRYFWMALAETVRLTCNARTSTYKLHIRPQEEILKRNISAIKIFTTLVYKNLEKFREHKNILTEKKVLDHLYRYKGNIKLALKNVAYYKPNKRFDLLVTSPPYGDNRTTVSYGQFSYLPLHWIDLCDIDNRINDSYLKSAYAIDNQSLGGSTREALVEITELFKNSKSLADVVKKLKIDSKDGAKRVAAFWRDMNKSLKLITSTIKTNGYMIWVVGNRKVAGLQIPMDMIMVELLTSYGVCMIERIQRNIPLKLTPQKNNFSDTMNKEIILITRKN
jgi:DNA modification methylase